MRRVLLAASLLACEAPAQPSARGVLLATLAWQAAEQVPGPDAVVVLPLGAAAKERGSHPGPRLAPRP